MRENARTECEKAHHDGAWPAKIQLREDEASERESGKAENHEYSLQKKTPDHFAWHASRPRSPP
jgi:hypothetical protein